MKISYQEIASKFALPDFLPETGASPLNTAPLHYAWKFSLAIPRAVLWPYIADTASFNRFIGLSSRTESEVEGKRNVQTTVFGIKQEWIEEPWQWTHERSLQFVRHYNQGITKAVRTIIVLEPTVTGVDVYFSFTWLPQNRAMRWFLQATNSVLHSQFGRALATVERAHATFQKGRPRALAKTNDPTKNVKLDELAKVQSRMKGRNASPEAVDALIAFLKFGDDVDLYRIRAIEIAENAGLKRKDVVTACMLGVREGLLTISWDVVCPHCRGVRLEADSLGNIPPNSECFVCDVDFETDTLESIEVTFHVHPSYRVVPQVLFCSAEPAKKDHIQVQRRILPREDFNVQIAFKEGRHRIRVKETGANLFFEIQKDTSDQTIAWDFKELIAADSDSKITCGPGSVFVLNNSADVPLTFTLEQLWWKDNILHPADIFAIQEFQDIFSRESLNSQVRLSLGVQTVLFTDIVNSTGFYSTQGDAAAFAQVRKHFTEIFGVISEQNGTVIKTIGDSVMACFLDPENGLQAAIKIQEVFSRERADCPIRLRASLHIGQVIAVHLNQGLDLFGNTVNKAAKLQSCAGAGEIAMSSEMMSACRAETVKIYQDFIVQRISGLQYKELPLQAEVLNCHDFMAIQKRSSRSA